MSNVVIKIAGQDYDGWQSLSYTRSIENMSGECRITATDLKEPWILQSLTENTLIDVMIDKILICRGYLRSVEDSIKNGLTITVRDRVADLIDCAAVVDGGHEFKDQKLDAVIKSVLTPYDIPLTVSCDVGASFKRLAINPGEAAFEFIERICRYRAVLPISDGVGGLHLIKPGTQDTGVALAYGENILDARMSIDYQDLYSEYIFKGQSEDSDFSTAEEEATPIGRAVDDKVKRYRPHVEVAEAQGYTQTLQERAVWQKQFNRSRAFGVTCWVQGFYANKEAGDLWRPNTMVHIKHTDRNLNRSMLIKSVTFDRSRSTVTQLDMVLPSAFDLPAVKEPQEDDTWGDL